VVGDSSAGGGPTILLKNSVNGTFEGGRVRLAGEDSTFRGGFMHYDATTNRMHIGVHDTGDTNPANDINAITIRRNNGHVGIGVANPTANLHVAGTTRTDVLEITGGSDLSERFDVASVTTADGTSIEPVPGMVVCIDPAVPGGLILSDSAYATAVAGVISGAGGVNPGMIMGQDGTLASGAHAVALTGRVYVWCDASTGPIRPGDRLTTSATPGHATAVRDAARAPARSSARP
jgi:hypothetical protein